MRKQFTSIPVLLLVIGLLVGCAPAAPTPTTPAAPAPGGPQPTPAAPAPSPAVSAPKPSAKVTRYSLGSTAATSSSFPLLVRAADLANKAVPEQATTVIVTGATIDNLVKLGQGVLDWAGATTWEPAVRAYQGKDRAEFVKAGPNTKLRYLMLHSRSPFAFMVTADSGVNKMKDLDGKVYSAGIPGSAAEDYAKKVFAALGIKPKYFVGSYADATNATKEGRCVGFVKAVTGSVGIDAAHLDVQSVRPIRFLSLTDEELKTALSAIFGLSSYTWKANQIKPLGAHPAINTIEYTNGFVALSTVPQDIGYRMWKAMVNGWDSIIEVYPLAAEVDPVAGGVKVVSGWAKVTSVPPFHAGMVQLMVEKGVQVPKELIPPEYKPVG